MSTTLTDRHRPVLVSLLAYVLSSGGLVISILSICIRQLIPIRSPESPSALPSSLESNLNKRRHSAPATCLNPPSSPRELPKSAPVMLQYTPPNQLTYAEPPPIDVVPRAPFHLRHLSFAGTATPRVKSLLSRSPSPQRRRTSLSPRSSLGATSASSAGQDQEVASVARSNSLSSAEAEHASSCSRRSSLSKHCTAPRLPSTRRLSSMLPGRRRASEGTTQDSAAPKDSPRTAPQRKALTRSSTCDSRSSTRNNAEGREGRERHGLGIFSSPWVRPITNRTLTNNANTETSSVSSSSQSPLFSAKSFTRRLSNRIKRRSPSSPPAAVPRTQPYGPPYYAAMPQWDDDVSSSSDKPRAHRASSSLMRPRRPVSMNEPIRYH